MESWIEVDCGGMKKKLWYSLFFTVMWSLWGYRNSIIFYNKVANWEEFVLILKNRWSSRGVGYVKEIAANPVDVFRCRGLYKGIRGS